MRDTNRLCHYLKRSSTLEGFVRMTVASLRHATRVARFEDSRTAEPLLLEAVSETPSVRCDDALDGLADLFVKLKHEHLCSLSRTIEPAEEEAVVGVTLSQS